MNVQQIKSLVLSVNGVKLVAEAKGRRNMDVLTFKELRSNLKFDVNLHNEEREFAQAVFLDLGFTKFSDETKKQVKNALAEFSVERFLKD